jgi:hypothetical protein
LPENQQDVDSSRHFSFYAFEGGHGESIWKHTSDAFHKDLENSADELRPQEDYRWVSSRSPVSAGGGGRAYLKDTIVMLFRQTWRTAQARLRPQVD